RLRRHRRPRAGHDRRVDDAVCVQARAALEPGLLLPESRPIAMTGPAATATTVAAVVPTAGATSALRPVSATDVRVTAGYWAERAATNRERTIPAGFRQLTDVGTLENFRLA